MHRRILGLIVVSCAVVFAGTAAVAHADNAKGNSAPTEALTAKQVHAIATKRAAESLFLKGQLPAKGPSRGVESSGVANPDVFCCGGGGGLPSSASIPGNQTPQIQGNYCGPATVHEMLNALGVGMSQDTAASRLGTDSSGTAWSGGPTSPTGYPIVDVVNNHENVNNYVPIYVASNTSSTLNTFENDLQMDVYGVGATLAGDAWEVPGGPHLVGHPENDTIFHWFDIRGYQNSGGSTMYEDSVHGASSIGWSSGVPAYSTMSSNTIVTIVSGRGYIW